MNTPSPDKTLSRWRWMVSDVRHFLAVGGGVGFSPVAPGTAGTLLAIPLYYAASAALPPLAVIIIAVVLLLVGIPICARANTTLNNHDDKSIVWDEVAAFFFVLACLPPVAAVWQWQSVAFVLFRLADIGKPFPISWLDKRVGGGWGVMVDDIAAAFVTLIPLWVVCLGWGK